MATGTRLPDYSVAGEPALCFDPVEAAKTDLHPLRGLTSFGPYGAKQSPVLVPSTIRIALITVEGYGTRVRDYLNSLNETHVSRAASKYFPPFNGFVKAFGVALQIPQRREATVVLLQEQKVRDALSSIEPEKEVLGLVESGIRQLMIRRQEFDVLLIYLPQLLEPVFNVYSPDYSFDLHDAVKAATASLGIPSQVILDRSIDYVDRCSVLWSLGLAIYAKAGGIPWKLASAPKRTAYVGLSYVLKTVDTQRRVLTCCSQVFDDQGHGLQFLLFTADDFTRQGRNAFLKRLDMRRLLAKTLELYVGQVGDMPNRLIVHKTTHFTREEREGAAEALGDLGSYELLQIQEETDWLAVKGQRDSPAFYPVSRGTTIPLSKYSFLLWTEGDAFGIAEAQRSFYQAQKGIPSPLLVTQHVGSATMLDTASELLGLTKMNWNTARLYNQLPVTVKSATKLGQIAKYMSTISQTPYQFRLFM